jgi:ComF family protein
MAINPAMQQADEADGFEPRRRFADRVRPLKRLARGLLDVVLPPLCIGCQARIMDHDALCPACWRQIAFIRPPLCDRLGIPMTFDTGGPTLSAAAIADPPVYDRARAVARFEGLMRPLIHGFKFHDNHNARRLFGRWLTAAGAELLHDGDIIVPVPMGRWRLLSRRFNQAQILAAEVGRRSGKAVHPFGLIRRGGVKHQVGLTRLQRYQNIAGAFQVPAGELGNISGKAIVLVDDVITSGATASAAAAALKRAGARRVDVLALAIVS